MVSSISEIQTKLKEFNTFAQHTFDPVEYKAKWKELFNMPLSSQSANAFASYYRDMRSNTRRSRRSRRSEQRGGSAAIQGAPLEYSMVPGMNIQAYGRFPIEAGTDPASISDLDVYFRDSLTADCGVKDSSLHVPANMGSNKVGGGARRSSRRIARRSRRTQRQRKVERRNRSKTFRQRGGDLLESITARTPFVYNSSVAPNVLQQLSHAWNGSTQAVPAPADPSVHTWEPRTHGMNAAMVNPGIVSYVPNDVGRLANPAPWMSSQ
jgi:hypothetical protein